jgi:hypothetical protein
VFINRDFWDVAESQIHREYDFDTTVKMNRGSRVPSATELLRSVAVFFSY